MEKPLTTHQAAAELGYQVAYLRQLLRKGKVKGQRFIQAWMIDPAEAERVKSLQRPEGRLPRTVPIQAKD